LDSKPGDPQGAEDQFLHQQQDQRQPLHGASPTAAMYRPGSSRSCAATRAVSISSDGASPRATMMAVKTQVAASERKGTDALSAAPRQKMCDHSRAPAISV